MTRITALRRVFSTTRGRIEVLALVLALAVCAGLAFEVVPAIADDRKLEGVAVPGEDVQSLVAAALSCPALTPPKLAAQLMVASGYGRDRTALGIAHLDPKTWDRWQPWEDAQRSDRQANFFALSRYTCDNVGVLRAAGVKGDLWAAAVAAGKVGLDAVKAAHRVPESAEEHVGRVKAYANWYADQPQFATGDEQDAAVTTTANAARVPDNLVEVVNAAGGICPATMTPARIAAQLSVLSGFDANKHSSSGAEGIAQMIPELWGRYRVRVGDSAWDPADSIAAMTVAMCDLTTQFAGLNGTDPYRLALGAYQWGPDAVRLAAGLPHANVPQLADETVAHTPVYQRDKRLKRTQATTPPSPTKPHESASPRPSPSALPSGVMQYAPQGTTVKYDPKAKYLLQNAWAGAVVDVPGKDYTDTADNTPVELWANLRTADMYWKIADAGGGWVTITNAHNGKMLTVENASSDDYTKLLLLAKPFYAAAAHWKLIDAGDGTTIIQNRASGKVMDLLGSDLSPPNADGTWNGYQVQQYHRQKSSRDQHWILVK